MQAKRLIPNSYLRWRHGRGFGIHSPFAYNFICLTLRERLPYYAYPALREELRRTGADMSNHDLGLIFRIVTRFMPESVAIFGDNNADVERTAVKAVSEHIVFSPEAPFVIINGNLDSAASHLVQAARKLVAVRGQQGDLFPELLCGCFQRGMLFLQRHQLCAQLLRCSVNRLSAERFQIGLRRVKLNKRG